MSNDRSVTGGQHYEVASAQDLELRAEHRRQLLGWLYAATMVGALDWRPKLASAPKDWLARQDA